MFSLAYVCLSAGLHREKTTRPIFTKFDGKKPLDFGSKPDRVILVSKEKVTQTWG